jgi:hypothetical protein
MHSSAWGRGDVMDENDDIDRWNSRKRGPIEITVEQRE